MKDNRTVIEAPTRQDIRKPGGVPGSKPTLIGVRVGRPTITDVAVPPPSQPPASLPRYRPGVYCILKGKDMIQD